MTAPMRDPAPDDENGDFTVRMPVVVWLAVAMLVVGLVLVGVVIVG